MVFAMPETALGLFPNIGASYFRSRLPGFYGRLISLIFLYIQLNYMLPCHFHLYNIESMLLLLVPVCQIGWWGNACMWSDNSFCPVK
ncbi:hypothetical protein ZEAMMB73_Zm00001d030059, partial [Zea mays]